MGKLIIEEPLHLLDYTDIWKVIISNMSGDDDAHEITESYFPKDSPTVQKIVDFCEWVDNERPDRKEIEKKHKEIFSCISEDEDNDWLRRDVFFDDCVCKPSLRRITFFDENGIEHRVTWR